MNHSTETNKLRIIWYGITIFLSSAVLLVLEITAGRLIAPYVGVSLYSWTSIIGVILAGLSLGNWLGGHWADKGGGEKAAGLVLALAGVFSIFSLLALTFIAPVLQNSRLDLISASFIYVLTMFFIPSVLLGIVTPLLTTLALKLDVRTGHIVGRMHALAALGSIIGTFATGYWLVQYFGTRSVITGAAMCLFMLSAPFFRRVSAAAPAGIFLAIAVVTATTYARNGFATPCDRESNYFCLRVVDVSDDAPFGTARALILDHLMHGINHDSEPGMLISPYVHLMDELVLDHFDDVPDQALRYFFAGGGAYTQPRAVQTLYPNAQITVAELDKAVTDMAKKDLYLNTDGMDIYHEDARVVLNRLSDQQYDVIVTDVFHDIAVPYHLVTLEFVQLVKSRLAPMGIYTVNIVDAFPDPKLVKSLVKTLQAEFQYVNVWLDTLPDKDTRMTYVISASNKKPLPDMLRARRGFDRQWFRINTPLFAIGTPLDQLPLLTDDFVPVERMISDLLLTPEGR
jgi:predicted membrane-bound spermidine synthase